jgi:ABC-type transport system involved in multi-copper enzyme maturation permease subunit
MNALIRKEIRLLFPTWVIGLATAFSAWSQPGGSTPLITMVLFALPYFVCPLMVVLLALSSFGRELSAGTFSNLLSQPVPRLRIWWTKTALLAAGVGSIWAVWWTGFIGHLANGMQPAVVHYAFATTLLLALAVFTGALWTVLLLRQVVAAFWFTLLAPGVLMTTLAYLFNNYPDAFVEPLIIATLSLYSIAGFVFARWLFLRAQDTQWTGGDITLPEVRGLAWLKIGWGARRGARPRAALLVKELQLHQAQLVVAGALVLLHLAVIALRKFGGEFTKQFTVEFILTAFWTLWLVMPLLVGCAAVAEERKLGTLEGQLCLPLKRRRQFVIKLGVVLLLSLVLGVAMPLLLEGSRILRDLHFDTERGMPFLFGYVGRSLTFSLLLETLVSQWLPLIILCVIATSIGALSFYTSTLMRNPLQALGPAVLAIIVTVMVLVGSYQPETFLNYPLWRGWLIYLVGVPVLTLTLAGLAYWNFKRVLVGWPVWRRNILVFLASLAFVIVTTSAVYHRAWEFLTPLEPPHGAPRLSPAQGVTLRNDGGNVVVQLPDGRVWTDLFAFADSVPWRLTGNWKVIERSPGGQYFGGTNWASVAVDFADFAGVKKDGSLWASAEPVDRRMFRQQASQTSGGPIKLERLGNDNDWKSVAGGSLQFFLLKTDGTLWRLGTNRFDWRKRWPGLRAFKPERLGAESDWAEFESSQHQIIFRKVDGQAWVKGYSGSNLEVKKFDRDLSLGRAPALDKHQWRSPELVTGFGYPGVQVGIRDNGVFGVCGGWRLPQGKTYGQFEWKDVDVRLGKESNWLAVAGNDQAVVTLKADGSLWKWEFLGDPIIAPWLARATKLGTHSDWVGISQDMGGIISLAADGSLWLWRFEEHPGFHSSDSPQPLLAITRKPQRIASVFGDAK